MTLREAIIARIRARGPMPFAAYMWHTLYHPRLGYYGSGRIRTGWKGHFVTSPELHPVFGRLWTHGFELIWQEAGRPDTFTIVEVGGGEGRFARSVLDSATGRFGDAIRYVLVERVAAVRERQRALLDDDRIAWSSSIADTPRVAAGCVFANEVLDNLPVHLAACHGPKLVEMCVGESGGELRFVPMALSTRHIEAFLSDVGVTLRDAARYEVSLAAQSFARRAAAVIDRGAVVLVDYGMTAQELAELPGGSLVCYSERGVDDDPLTSPGEKDITCHANWTAVAAALRGSGCVVTPPVAQRDVLRALGATVLDGELKQRFAASAGVGRGNDAVRALSARQALAALVDPGGLGALGVLAAAKNMTLPRPLAASSRE